MTKSELQKELSYARGMLQSAASILNKIVDLYNEGQDDEIVLTESVRDSIHNFLYEMECEEWDI